MTEPARTMFKHDMQTRVDVRLEADKAEAARILAWNREIDKRDGRRCRACGKHTNPDEFGLLRGHRAHIIYASAQGTMEPCNRVTLCPADHNAEHKDRLRFTREGGPYVGIDANTGMEFWRKDDAGAWYLSRRELAPHQVERD